MLTGSAAVRRHARRARAATLARPLFAHRPNPPRVEPLEPRRLLSVAPAAPDLLPASDSGVSDTDDVTHFNDAGAERALRFAVRGTLPGATVTLLADGAPVATATATSDETLLSTPGTLALAPGFYSFTARQALAGEPDAPTSPPTGVLIDTVAPPRPGTPDLRPASDRGVSDRDNLTNDTTPTLDLPLAGAPYYRLFHNGRLISPPYAAANPYTATGLVDGEHTFVVEGVDAAGNVSEPSEALRITLDTVAPPAGWLAGTADRNFDNNGRASLSSGDGQAVAVQPDGKILVAGNAAGVMVIARRNVDGTPDVSFGDGGRVDIPGSYSTLLRLQPDGGIIVAGSSEVFRLTAGGQRDPSFGDGGSARVNDQIIDLAVDAAGRVLLVRISLSGEPGGVKVVRLTPDGAKDATFGGTGQVNVPVGVTGGLGMSVVAAPDGKVLVGGYAVPPPPRLTDEQRMFVLRLEQDGTPDETFGAGRGYVQHRVNGWSQAGSTAVQADGKILVGGVCHERPGGEVASSFIARLAPDGALDPSFGGTGLRIVPGNGGRVALLPSGDSFLITSPGDDIALTHFDANGRLDPALPDGTAVTPSGADVFTITDSAVAPDGDVLLVGVVYSTRRITVWRMHGRTEGVPDLQSASDTGASAEDNLTNDATPTFDLTAPPTAPPDVYLRLYRNGVLVSRHERPGPYTAPPQPDGTWGYATGVIDAAGNESIGPALRVTIDTAAPQVTGVSLAATSWPAAFLSHLQSAGLGGGAGFDVAPDGPAAPPLPWLNLNRVTLTFGEPLAVRREDLTVLGATVEQYGVESFSADAPASTATWTLGRTVPAEKLLLTLSDRLADAAGNRVRFGPAAAGADGRPALRIDVLPADVNRSGAVSPVDAAQVRARLGSVAGAAGRGPRDYTSFHDFNVNGRIDPFDVLAVRARMGQALPASEPVVPAPVPMPAPAPAPLVAVRVGVLGNTNNESGVLA